MSGRSWVCPGQEPFTQCSTHGFNLLGRRKRSREWSHHNVNLSAPGILYTAGVDAEGEGAQAKMRLTRLHWPSGAAGAVRLQAL